MPSRRQLIGAVGVSLAASSAGCARFGGDGDVTATATTTPASEPVAVRLVGPETDTTLFDGEDTATVGTVQESRDGAPYFSVELTEDAAASVSETFREAGVGDDPDPFEVLVDQGGETLNRFGITRGLAESIAAGEWSGSFVLQFASTESARSVRESFVAGGD